MFLRRSLSETGIASIAACRTASVSSGAAASCARSRVSSACRSQNYGSAVTRAVTNTKMRPFSQRSMLPNWPLTRAISDATRLSRALLGIPRIDFGSQCIDRIRASGDVICFQSSDTSPNAFLNRSFLASNAAISLFFASRSVHHRLKENPNNANSTVTSTPATTYGECVCDVSGPPRSVSRGP